MPCHPGGSVDRLTQSFAPDHFNHAFLQDQDAHGHLHVILCYAATRHFAGLEFDDPDYGDHYGLHRVQLVSVGFAMQLRSTFDRLAPTT